MIGAAMVSAIAEIQRQFGVVAEINHFKKRVRAALCEPDHPAVSARYGARVAALVNRPLHIACIVIDDQYRAARQAFAIANAFGHGNRLSLAVLRELRLILRWMRFTRRHDQFVAMVHEIERRAA